jgi:Ca-activated chloride channel family protein
MASRSPALIALLALSAASTACGAAGFDGGYGVTPGGSQDIELARELIEGGAVPSASQFTAEGLFSQHDFSAPVTSACAQRLCPRASVAQIEPVDGSGEQVLVHLALDTNIEEFERADLNLALVVDISGSMLGEKLDATKLALHTIVDQLDENDRLTLVSFSDDARTEVPSTITDAGGRATLHGAISAFEVEGATNIEAGLMLGYAGVDEHHDGFGGVEDRVMLFTDAQPNVGATGTGSFLQLVRDGSEQGMGISVFGVGLDLGVDLAREISEVRGGNSFYLDADTIATIFEDEFDTIVTPVAYSLHFNVRPTTGFAFSRTYGTPDADADGEVDFSVATGFLSSSGGAMAVLLEGDLSQVEQGQPVAWFSLEYETVDGELLDETFDVAWLGGDLPIGEAGRADHAGSAKLAVLLDEYLALAAGSLFCDGQLSEPEALARIDQAADRLDEMASLIGDDPLQEEAALMRQLAENVAGAGCLVSW